MEDKTRYIYVLKLKELRNIYGNEPFALAYAGKDQFDLNLTTDNIILPKEVTIKEDLTVWRDGACIINGMKDVEFISSRNLKHCEDHFFAKLIQSEKFTKSQINLFKMGKVREQVKL